MSMRQQLSSALDQVTLPMCAVCGRSVERMERYADPLTMEMVFQVSCHGEHERVRLDERILHLNPRALSGGVAFAAHPALEGDARRLLA